MLRFARQNPYAAWTILCLIVGVVLAVWAYANSSANFPIEAGLSEEILAKVEHNRAESATAVAIGAFSMPLPFFIAGLVVIWSARRWR
jgi:hypothetical protein